MQNNSLRFIKNVETGVVFKFSEYMGTLSNMAECDSKGAIIDPNAPVKRTRKPRAATKTAIDDTAPASDAAVE